jgi:hypothetical protein
VPIRHQLHPRVRMNPPEPLGQHFPVVRIIIRYKYVRLFVPHPSCERWGKSTTVFLR